MQNSQTNTFLKGMNLDTAKEFIGSDQYTYAENIHLSAKDQTEGCITTHKSLYTTGIDINSDTVLATTSGNMYLSGDVVECYIVLSRLSNGEINLSAYSGVSTIDQTPSKVFDLTSSTLQITSDRVKIINVYDNPQQSNVYIASQGSELQVVNLQADNDPNDTFSMFPETGALPPMEFYDEVVGALDNCSVQYAYQLFDVRGKYTALSAVSSVIPVGTGKPGVSSGLGLQLKITGNFENYSKIRVYKIKYTSSLELPNVYIKDEINISGNTQIIYQDTSEKFLTQITLDEFQNIKRIGFSAATIEFFNNRLYAANLTENLFTVEFDARAYRCDDSGTVKLESDANVQETITTTMVDAVKPNTIAQDHDAINPSLRSVSDEKYSYTNKFGNLFLGGSGPNVDYCFVHPYVYLSANNSMCIEPGVDSNVVSSDLSFNAGSFTLSAANESKFYAPCTIPSGTSQFVTEDYIDYDDIAYVAKDKSFKDTYFSTKFRGYKRGEIYSFGIVFYNRKHQPSQVHWIGDIKIPNSDYPYIAAYSDGDTQHDCVGSSVGIRFKVDLSNIDQKTREDISAFEIVRCDRTMADKTILCQGICSKLNGIYVEDGYLDRTSFGKLSNVPFCKNTFVGIYAIDELGYYISEQDETKPYANAVAFISPDVSVNRESTDGLLDGMTQMQIKGFLTSVVYNESPFEKLGNGLIVFKHVTQGVVYTTDRPETNAKIQGRIVGQYDNHSNRNRYVFGITSTNALYNQTDDIFTDTLYKFFTPVRDDKQLEIKTIGVRAYKYITPYDPTQGYDVNSSDGDVVGNLVFQNICNNVPLVGGGSAIGNAMDIGKYFGAGGPKLILLGDFHNLQILEERGSGYVQIVLNNKFKRVDDFVRYSTFADNIRDASEILQVAVPIVELTRDVGNQYGGFSKTARLGRSYQSIGCYSGVKKDQSVFYINCFGGDTFIELHNDVWSSYMTHVQNDGDAFPEVRNTTVRISYPVETSINLSRTHGIDLQNPKYLYERKVLQDPAQIDSYVQTEQLNAYNDVYSPHATNIIHVVPGSYDYDNKHLLYRVVVSNVKNFGEVEDNLQDFDTLNYLDVDAKYGPITNLISNKERLYYTQSRCFGMISSEERSLVQDTSGSSLLLGTGTVLQRYITVSVDYGDNIINDNSILCSDSGIYWFDSLAKDLVLYDGSRIGGLSNTKNVNGFFKTIKSEIHSGRNRQSGEIWFKAKDDNRALIYNENIGQFVSYYTDNVEYISLMKGCSVGIDVSKNQLIKLHDNEAGVKHNSMIHFVVNDNPLTVKVFDTLVVVDTNLPTHDGNNLQYQFECKTTRQTSTQRANGRMSTEGVYYLPIGRDENAERMRGRTLTVKFVVNGEFNIPSIQTVYRQSRT